MTMKLVKLNPDEVIKALKETGIYKTPYVEGEGSERNICDVYEDRAFFNKDYPKSKRFMMYTVAGQASFSTEKELIEHLKKCNNF